MPSKNRFIIMMGDELSEDEHIKLLLAVYRDNILGDPEFTKDLILSDLYIFEQAEQYEICARLKKILDQLE